MGMKDRSAEGENRVSASTWSTPAPVRQQGEQQQQRAQHRVPAWSASGSGAVAPLLPADRLPRRTVQQAPAMWVLGVHGGAGESVLASVLEGAAQADHAWPVGPGAAPVLLTARTTMSGLRALQHAVADWASGETDALLVGVVLIADSPTSLPRHMTDVIRRLESVAPRAWHLPWCMAWREIASPTVAEADRRLRHNLTNLASYLTLNLAERTNQ